MKSLSTTFKMNLIAKGIPGEIAEILTTLNFSTNWIHYHSGQTLIKFLEGTWQRITNLETTTRIEKDSGCGASPTEVCGTYLLRKPVKSKRCIRSVPLMKPFDIHCRRHKKGRCYLVVADALHTTTQETLRVYTDGERWFVRPLAEFEDGRFDFCNCVVEEL